MGGGTVSSAPFLAAVWVALQKETECAQKENDYRDGTNTKSVETTTFEM